MKDKEPFVRINSRVPQYQIDFIKKFAKRDKKKPMTEGETHRFIIDFFMSKHKDMADVIPKP